MISFGGKFLLKNERNTNRNQSHKKLMDFLYNPRKSQKMKSLNASISKNFNMDSALIIYLRGRSPVASPGTDCGRPLSLLSMVENVKSPPPLYGTLVKVVDGDVLVMDGILMQSLAGGRVSKSPLTLSSGGSSSEIPHSTYKTELCRSWEDFGRCRYGSKCQFSLGELCATNFIVKNKSEVQTYWSNTDIPYKYSPKLCFLSPVMAQATVAGSETIPEHTSESPVVTIKHSNAVATPISEELVRTNSPAKTSNGDIKSDGSKIIIVAITALDNWLPQEDGIGVSLPCQTDRCPSRDDVHAYLCGPSRRKRLPVFSEICPE